MKKIVTIVVVSLALFALIFILFKKEMGTGKPANITAISEKNVENNFLVKRNELKPISTTSALKIPSLDKVREEVEQNPEMTPPSLIHFASELGQKLSRAMSSREAAVDYAKELEDCIHLNDETVAPIKKLCEEHAKILLKKYEDIPLKLE